MKNRKLKNILTIMVCVVLTVYWAVVKVLGLDGMLVKSIMPSLPVSQYQEAAEQEYDNDIVSAYFSSASYVVLNQLTVAQNRMVVNGVNEFLNNQEYGTAVHEMDIMERTFMQENGIIIFTLKLNYQAKQLRVQLHGEDVQIEEWE